MSILGLANKRLLVLSLMLTLTACGGGTAVQCTAESAQAPVISIVKEQLEKAISKDLVKNESGRVVSLSKIRAAIGQLVIAIDDIRTSKEDPNSTKRFCTGTLKIRFPADVLADADKTRTALNMNSVSDLAEGVDVERHADSFTTSIDFNIQPTDDGSKVFAETESGNNMFGFATEVLSSGLLRASVEDSKRQQQQAVDQQAAAEGAALTEQRNANLDAARTDNQLAVQIIGATWKALPSDTRSQLLPVQRAWIRKKDADCAVEAASASIDVTDKEVARLGCDSRVSRERASWLQQYRSDESGSAPLPDTTSDTKPQDF